MKTYTMQDFLDGKVAVVSGTRENAKKFFEEMEGLGITWRHSNESLAKAMESKETIENPHYALVLGYWGDPKDKLSRWSDGAAGAIDDGIIVVDYTDLITEPREELHITTKGRDTWAVYKRNGEIIRKEKVTRNPNDEHDFSVAARVAVARIFDLDEDAAMGRPSEPKKPQVREVEREAEVGEWFKVIRPCATSGRYEMGSIGQIVEKETSTYSAIAKFGNRYGDVIHSEYLVLEGYQPGDSHEQE